MFNFWRAGMTIVVTFWMFTSTAIAVPTCLVSDITMGSTPASDCSGWYYSGNPTLSDLNTMALFGESDWQFLAKQDDEEVTGGINLMFEDLGDTSGTWSVAASAFDSWSEVVFTLKNGNGWSAYLFDNPAAFETSGTWQVAMAVYTNGREFYPGLSNVNVFARGTGVEVSEPAILALAGFLLIAFGLVRCKK